MKKFRRLPIIALSMLTTGILLSGCAATGADDDGITTIRMVGVPGPEGEAMQKVADEYNAGQGKIDGVEVELAQLPRGDQYSKIAALMSARSSEFDVYKTASYVVAQQQIGLDPVDFIDSSAYLPVTVDSLTLDGKLYGVPMDVSNHFLYYRTDLIEALLSSPEQIAAFEDISEKVLGERLSPKEPAEWTWDDFIATSAYFTQAHNAESPTEYGAALQLKNLLFNTMIWNDLLWSFGGSWTDGDGNAALDSEAARQAIEVYSTMYEAGLTSPDAVGAEFPETQAALSSGNAALAIQWSAAYKSLNNPDESPLIAGKIGIAPVPGEEHKTHVHTLGQAINKYSENKEAAKKWLTYLATEPAAMTYAENGGIPPVAAVLEALGEERAEYPVIADHVFEYGFSAPAFPRTYSAYVSIAENLSAAWAGQEDVDDALARANEDLQKLLDE